MKNPKKNGLSRAVPFLVVLAVVSAISFIIPLRPKVSYDEKRELAKFPAFSVSALASGSYFEEITLWYSDTFPGREGWLDVSKWISQFHGSGSISLEGELADFEPVPDIPEPTRPAPTLPPETTEPEETEPETTEAPEETAPAETEAEDGEILLDATVSATSIIQIGGSAYQPLGFSQSASDRYVRIISRYADAVTPQGVRVVSAPPPIAIGTEVDAKFLPELRSSDPKKTMEYLHGSMSENVVTVDTQSALDAHRGEYMFFHSDHHWTALGAYYCYEAICETLGKTPARLEDFEVLDQGEFRGTLFGRATRPFQLTKDSVISYIPPGDITLTVYGQQSGQRDGTVIRDLRKAKLESKYLCFLEGDQPLVLMVNHDLPEDAGNCIIIKDSFGNCLVPYFSQNYRNVYAMDYRKYAKENLLLLVEKYDLQDVIFAPNLMSTQSEIGMDCLSGRCGVGG